MSEAKPDGAANQDFLPEEREILQAIMRSTGQTLDQLNISLILEQARAIGEL
jgi:hypothetical protein